MSRPNIGLWATLLALLVASLLLSCLFGFGPASGVGTGRWSVGASARSHRRRIAASHDLFDVRLPSAARDGLWRGAVAVRRCDAGVFRNPLADPFVLGTVSGATLGAALVVLFHHENTLGAAARCVCRCAAVDGDLAFGVRASAVAYFDQGSLILVGVALGSLLSALTGIALFASRTDQVQSLVYWLFGSFAMSQWPTLMLVTICAIPTAIFAASERAGA